MGPTSRFFPIWLMASTISAKVIRYYFCHYFFLALFQPLFGLLSTNRAAQIPAVDYYRHVRCLRRSLFYFRTTVTIQHFSRIDCWWYLSWLCFNAGAPVEVFIEESAVAVISDLVARGCLAVLAGRCVASIVGIMFTINQFVFWLVLLLHSSSPFYSFFG